MKILVKASCPSNTNIPFCRYAVYTIGLEELQLLRMLRTIFGNANELAGDLYQMVFFGSFAVFYDADISAVLSENDRIEFEANDYIRLPDEFATDCVASPTEMELIVIADDGFFCTVIPKYTTYTIETTGIGYDVFGSTPIIDVDPDTTKFDRVSGKRIGKEDA